MDVGKFGQLPDQVGNPMWTLALADSTMPAGSDSLKYASDEGAYWIGVLRVSIRFGTFGTD